MDESLDVDDEFRYEEEDMDDFVAGGFRCEEMENALKIEEFENCRLEEMLLFQYFIDVTISY